MNLVLVRAIVDLAAFLSLSGEKVIAPDAAQAQLEQLAFSLKELSAGERAVFVRTVALLAQEEAAAGVSLTRQRFVAALPASLGRKMS